MMNIFAQPDPHANGVMGMLENLYPAFAKKIFQGNEIMRRIVLSGFSPLDILEYPICGRCETPAAWNGMAMKDGALVQKCTCLREKCGAHTLAPIVFKDWMADELRRKAPPEIAEVAENVVSALAASMMQMAIRQYTQAQTAQQGILMPDGTVKEIEYMAPEQKATHVMEERPIDDEEMHAIVEKELEALEDV
jgi:hypothetical protein